MTPRALLGHYSAIVQLVRHLVDDQTGGVFGAAVEMITKVTSVKGVMAYRVQGTELVLVAEAGLPRRAKAWLAHLPIDDEPWFIAQRVAVSQRGEVGSQLADSRMGHSIQPTLEAEGWRGLACSPIRVGREVHGVIVLATGGTTFDKQTLMFLDTVCGVLGLASVSEAARHQARDEAAQATKTTELATLGLLAAAVAKDVRGPIETLDGQLDAFGAWVAAACDPELSSLHVEMTQAITQLRETVTQLDGLGEEEPTESVELGRCMDDTIALLAHSVADRGVELELAHAPQPLYVEGRRAALQMLLVQVLLYAVDACAADRVEVPLVRLSLASEAGRCVLAVAMTGSSGQRSDARIFEGMLRNKSSLAATGLDLAHKTVAAHGGTIEVSDGELGGPLISISRPETLALEPASEPAGDVREPPRVAAPSPTAPAKPATAPMPRRPPFAAPPPPLSEPPLPLPPREAPADRTPLTLDLDLDDGPGLLEATDLQAPAAAAGGSDRGRLIVWIDDDLEFLRAMARSITTHETLLVTTLTEAVELFEDLDVAPELVLCDIMLPDGLGTDLHRSMPRELADRFVFVTGGVISKDVADYLKGCGRPTLIKPITFDEVHNLLQDAASRPAQATLVDDEAAELDLPLQGDEIDW